MRHLALLPVLLAACTVGDVEPRVVSADEALPDDLVAGDVVQKGALELVVPEPGQQVAMTAEYEDGTSEELIIRNPIDGVVELVTPSIEPVVIAAGASTTPCQDGAYHLAGHKWTSEYQWRFQAGSTPSANSKDNVETALVHAAQAIVNSRNDCGLADQVSATQRYVGRTTAGPNIRGSSTGITCLGNDGKNVVGFGPLPSGTLGVACSWTDAAGHAIEGDITLSTRNAWYALAVPEGCSNRYGVQPIATHELGHVFGLGHVSESTHPNLTMSTAARPCSNAPYTLGLGDVRGLRALY